MFKTVIYDKSDIYNKEILPLIEDIKEICTMNKIPMFITVAVANDEKKTTFKNSIIHGVTGIKLSDDRISDIILRFNHFKMNHPKKYEIMMSELEDYLDTITVEGNEEIPDLTDRNIEDYTRITKSDIPQEFQFVPPESENDGEIKNLDVIYDDEP